MNIGLFRHGDQAAAALFMARLAGCNCDPDIEPARTDRHGIRHIAVKHDDHCRLLAVVERRN